MPTTSSAKVVYCQTVYMKAELGNTISRHRKGKKGWLMPALPLLVPEHPPLGVTQGLAKAKTNFFPGAMGKGELGMPLFPGVLLKPAQNTQPEKCQLSLEGKSSSFKQILLGNRGGKPCSFADNSMLCFTSAGQRLKAKCSMTYTFPLALVQEERIMLVTVVLQKY